MQVSIQIAKSLTKHYIINVFATVCKTLKASFTQTTGAHQ